MADKIKRQDALIQDLSSTFNLAFSDKVLRNEEGKGHKTLFRAILLAHLESAYS